MEWEWPRTWKWHGEMCMSVYAMTRENQFSCDKRKEKLHCLFHRMETVRQRKDCWEGCRNTYWQFSVVWCLHVFHIIFMSLSVAGSGVEQKMSLTCWLTCNELIPKTWQQLMLATNEWINSWVRASRCWYIWSGPACWLMEHTRTCTHQL